MLSQPIETAGLSDVVVDASNLLWVDVNSPDDRDLDLLKEEFGFHELALEDARKRGQRPKLDAYPPHFYFLVMYGVTFDVEKLRVDEHELHIFVGKNYIVTVHEGRLPELEEVARRWEQNANNLSTSVGVLLYSLLDTLMDGYLPVLDVIAEQSDLLETRIFDRFQPRAQAEIFALRKELLRLRRVLGPQRDVLLQLSRREIPVLEENTEKYFQDVYDHVARATDSVDLYRDLLNSALEAYLSLSSNNLNVVMRTLTSVSIILMTLSFIVGVYGMNFVNMPELRTHYGYFVVLLVMAAITGVLYRYFHRKRWL